MHKSLVPLVQFVQTWNLLWQTPSNSILCHHGKAIKNGTKSSDTFRPSTCYPSRAIKFLMTLWFKCDKLDFYSLCSWSSGYIVWPYEVLSILSAILSIVESTD